MEGSFVMEESLTKRETIHISLEKRFFLIKGELEKVNRNRKKTSVKNSENHYKKILLKKKLGGKVKMRYLFQNTNILLDRKSST